MELNLVHFAPGPECVRWYRQHGWIHPDTNNALWSNSSFAHPGVDKYFGDGIFISHHGPFQSDYLSSMTSGHEKRPKRAPPVATQRRDGIDPDLQQRRRIACPLLVAFVASSEPSFGSRS
jgi:hypothetical protein